MHVSIVCKIFGHKFKYLLGMYEYESSYCVRCGLERAIINEEAKTSHNNESVKCPHCKEKIIISVTSHIS